MENSNFHFPILGSEEVFCELFAFVVLCRYYITNGHLIILPLKRAILSKIVRLKHNYLS